VAAPLGNQNAAKAKQWSAAIERALDRLGDPTINPDVPIERSPRMKAYDMLADKFVAGVNGADLAYFREFGDRMDGKPAQTVDLGNKDGEPFALQKIERVIVDVPA
jgi:hypothetical protein